MPLCELIDIENLGQNEEYIDEIKGRVGALGEIELLIELGEEES